MVIRQLVTNGTYVAYYFIDYCNIAAIKIASCCNYRREHFQYRPILVYTYMLKFHAPSLPLAAHNLLMQLITSGAIDNAFYSLHWLSVCTVC